MAVSILQKTSSSISPYTYHVFLSFRGEDTRKSFADHLYNALVEAGIRTFRDENDVEKGENIEDGIRRGILRESKMSLIVFSKNYASSTWCLDEVVKIMEHRETSDHIVLPIFYDIDPTDVRKQIGSFGEAFAEHEERFKADLGKVTRWRAALREVADLSGMVLQDRHESVFIQDIVRHIQNKFRCTTLYVPTYLVGTDVLVTCINWWLEDESNKVGIATMCGIGGIGKTTIAKVVYNQNIHRFQGASFLADVREATQEHSGLVRLQRQLISDILKGKSKKIYNADDGITKIKDAIYGRRVLLVLDDVDDPEKITKIIGTLVPFHPGSKVIVTSRHRHLLSDTFVSQMFDLEASSSSSSDLHKVFEVKELAFTKSLQLFNWHAFGHNPITESYIECASSVVKHCGGIPLALQVLGSSLCGKGINVWRSALEKLEAIPDSKIQKILRISYDALQDDHDKNLFLDIACVFVGKDRDYTTTILDSCGFYTTSGIENLIDRCLLIVDEKNKLMMHQMVREMGREVIRQESTELGERSRLWHKDAFDVLTEKSGTKKVKCLTIDLQGSPKTSHSKDAFLMSSELDFETEAFAEMEKLKLLQLDYVKLKGDYKNFPKGLIWLRWNGFSLDSLPMDLDIKRLVALHMRYSSLKQVWNGIKIIPNLKILNLNHSHNLLKTPNFSGLHSLERLMLKGCIKLFEVDRSIGELKRLIFLNLGGCQSLRKLPRTIGNIESLEELILSGCSRLDDVPRELQNLKSLKVLNLDGTAIYETNSWLSWIQQSLMRSKELGFCWANLPCSLVKLSLESCKLSDDVIPHDLSILPSLKSLNLSRNPIRRLPESISNLQKLDELKLTYCTELQSLPKLPISSINGMLHAKITPSTVCSLPYLFSLKRCVIFGCEKLSEIEDVYKMQPMDNYKAEEIKSLFNLDTLQSNEVQIYNYLSDTKIIATPQVIYEQGITSTFIPGSEVPNSFEHRYKGPTISFTLPPYPGEKIKWLNLCIVYSAVGENVLDFPPSIEVTNESKENTWGYRSNFIGIPEANDGTLVWIIHWPVHARFQLEGGDHLSCTMQPFDLEIIEFGFACGLETNGICELDSPHYFNPGNEDIVRDIGSELAEALLRLSPSGNVKVHICNRLEDSNRVTSPQVLYDCGITTMFDAQYTHKAPRAIWYRYHAFGPEICFTAPPNSNQQIRWLNSKIMLSHTNNYDDDKTTSEFLLRVEMVNETKGTKWSYYKSFPTIPGANSTLILWLNSWKFSGQIEAGDRVSMRVVSDLTVLECGINPAYEEDDHNMLYNTSFLFGTFICLLFRCLRSSYRMQSLVKEY